MSVNVGQGSRGSMDYLVRDGKRLRRGLGVRKLIRQLFHLLCDLFFFSHAVVSPLR
jgi:hypothetical protein